MEKFDLDTELLQFGTGDSLSQPWRIRNSILGVQAWGANGSGKSSSMRTLALKYIRNGYGFLILSAKSERETWEEYCRLAGRSDDLIRIGVDSPARFDFMKYLSESKSGAALTGNLLNILKTVIHIDGDKGNGHSDPFWQQSLDLLLHNTISLSQLSYGHVTVQTMYDIVQSAPAGSEDGQSEGENNPESAFNKAFEIIRQELSSQVKEWQETWSDEEKKTYSNCAVFEAAIIKKFPKARPFKFVEQFFFETFKTLSFKTKSIILLSLSSFLFSLLQDPVYSLFCSGEINVTPEDSLNGKIILLDLPTKHFHEAGRSAQLLFKLIWMLQMEKRDISANSRPVCLWSDESHEFIMPEHDAKFQATARSSRVSLVYIAQNVHQYYSAVSKNAHDRIASFLGVLNTHIYFSNACATTNKMASERIGDALFYDPNESFTAAKNFSRTRGQGLKVDKLVPPHKFISLRTGGPANGFMVEAYIHVQGDSLFDGQNFKKIHFNQNYQ